MVNYQLEQLASSTSQSIQSEKDVFNWCNVTYCNTSKAETRKSVPVHISLQNDRQYSISSFS